MNEHCSACGATIASRSGVHVGNMDETRLMCSRCYNESVAEYLSLDYEHIEFDPITLKGSEWQFDSVRHEYSGRTGYTYTVEPTTIDRLLANEEESIYGH